MIQNIVFLPIKEPKLTIAKTEVRVKLPEGISGEERVKILSFFNDVATQVGTPERTLRGQFHEGRVCLRTSDKKHFKNFYLYPNERKNTTA